MVEVDSFPNVQGDRTRAHVGRVFRAGTLCTVKAIASAVDAIRAVNADHGRGGVGLVRLEHDLAGQEQLGCAECGATKWSAFDNVTVVTAPREAQAPSLAALEVGARREGELGERVVVASAALAALAHEVTDLNLVPLRLAFVHPAASEVEGVGHVVGHRQVGGERVDLERRET